MEPLRHRIAIEKLKEKLLIMIDISNNDVKEAYESGDVLKVAFNRGSISAMKLILEDIYSDTQLIEE